MLIYIYSHKNTLIPKLIYILANKTKFNAYEKELLLLVGIVCCIGDSYACYG